jgi:hypothetical protein
MYDDKAPDLANYPPAASLDAAYERSAILEGWKFKTTFPENEQLYKDVQEDEHRRSKCSCSC